MVSALGQLFEAERAHWESLQARLREALAQEKHIRSAWLYGSVARATDEPRSDVDLALAVDEDTPDVLRDVMGNLLPEIQERRYRRILSFKDEVPYGTRKASREEGARLLADLEEFARWAEDVL